MKQTSWMKCDVCGLLCEAVIPCSCEVPHPVSCCGKPMRVLEENTVDAAREKHVPVLVPDSEPGTIRVQVGSVPHPMTEAHSIGWIEVQDGDSVYRRYLKPGDAPECTFPFEKKPGLILREWCNIHGIWSAVVES